VYFIHLIFEQGPLFFPTTSLTALDPSKPDAQTQVPEWWAYRNPANRGFAHVSTTTVNTSQDFGLELSSELDQLWQTYMNDQHLSKFGVDMEDPRVRKYNEDEVLNTRACMAESAVWHWGVDAFNVRTIPLLSLLFR
jgi:hypothetical protein